MGGGGSEALSWPGLKDYNACSLIDDATATIEPDHECDTRRAQLNSAYNVGVEVRLLLLLSPLMMVAAIVLVVKHPLIYMQ